MRIRTDGETVLREVAVCQRHAVGENLGRLVVPLYEQLVSRPGERQHVPAGTTLFSGRRRRIDFHGKPFPIQKHQVKPAFAHADVFRIVRALKPDVAFPRFYRPEKQAREILFRLPVQGAVEEDNGSGTVEIQIVFPLVTQLCAALSAEQRPAAQTGFKARRPRFPDRFLPAGAQVGVDAVFKTLIE